jgi:hypothetical protein
MQFNSMSAWKDAYRAGLGFGLPVNEFELSEAELATVQGASRSHNLNTMAQLTSYPAGSNNSSSSLPLLGSSSTGAAGLLGGVLKLLP